MTRALVRAAAGALIIYCCTSAGCGKSGPAYEPVEGTARLNGKPLANVHIEFWPEVSGRRSMGKTDAEGRYQLTSEDGKKAGALVGSHRVILTDLSTVSDKPGGGREVDDGPIRKARFPARYESSAATPLKKEVRAGDKNVLDLDVTTP